MVRNNKYIALSPGDIKKGKVNVIVDTPKGSRNKYKFDVDLEIFILRKVLPAGSVFPFNFGYIPSTKGGDGDPLDVLVLMDEPAFAGCLVESRLVGVIQAEQEEAGKKGRNDRLLAVADVAQTFKDIHSIGQLNERLVDEVEHFFVSYNEMAGKVFHPLKRSGPVMAKRIVEEGIKQFKRP